MARRRADVDGCGCSRCQDVDPRVLDRSLFDGVCWSGALPFRRPSILVVFGVVAAAQLAVLVSTTDLVVVGALASLVGTALGRGYVGVVGRDALARAGPSRGPLDAVRVVLRRFPAFCVAVCVVLAALGGVVGAVTALRAPARAAAAAVGVTPVVANAVLFLAVAGVVLYALLKCCFLPEACFVGGYGPVGALRASWAVATVHRSKALRVVAGFALLLAVGVAVDAQFADPTRPVTLSVRYGETVVALRSFGFAPGPRFVVDALTTLLYSGVFVHQYVQGVVES
jgi:hypothetical protein